MAFKFIAVFALVAVVSAGVVPAPQVYQAPVAYVAPVAHYAAPTTVLKAVAPVAYAAQPVLAKAHEEYDPHPQYKYSYDVQDSISGDSKNQVEERNGDAVRGEYSLNDADGFRRTVQYTADDINGFNAVVHREPLVKAVTFKAVAPVTYTAPIAHYAAPAAVVKTVAPVTHYTAPAVVKTVAPAATYSSYSAPTVYEAHH